MKLISAELFRIYFTYGKNVKTSLISIAIFATLIFLMYNRFSDRLSEYPDLIVLIVSAVFFLRILLSALTSPINEITKEIDSKRITFLNSLYYKFDTLISLRIFFLSIINILLGLLFLISIDLLLGQNFNINYVNYLLITYACLVGVFSVFGLGFIISGLMLYTKMKNSFIVIIQIMVFYGIFAFPNGHFLIPFSNAKLLIYNLLSGNQIPSKVLLLNISSIFISSFLFYLVGIIIFRYFYYLTVKNKSLLYMK